MPTLALAAFAGCGPHPPPLPPPLPTVVADDDSTPDAQPVEQPELLRDRALGRTGLACADCHPVPGAAALRPAPPLDRETPRPGAWSGRASSRAAAIALCVERHLARPTPPAAALDALTRALDHAPAAAPPAPTEPAALYDAACRHCHEAGPAGPVLGRRWRRAALRRRIRGLDRHRHPSTLMPALTEAHLPEPALSALIGWIVDTPPADTASRL